MPRLNAEDIKKTMAAKDKEALTSWYSTLLYHEGLRLQNQTFTPTGPWNEKTEREIRLRTFEAERESHMERLKENLSHLPGAYFDILYRMMHDFNTEEIRGLLDVNDKASFNDLYAAFREHDHDAFHRVLDKMSDGNFPIRDPHTVSEEYFHRVYRDFDLADLEQLDVETIDEATIAQTPEIKDNPRYSDKDRAVALKKEIARLEKAEKERVEARKSDQKSAKGYYQIYLRETGETRSKDEIKALGKQYDEYEKENKKLDAAMDSYFKVKLERDKLRAKLDILGELSSREQKKLQEYEQKTIQAGVNREVVKDRMIHDLDEKLAKEGKDPASPHNAMRRAQIMQGDTRYFPLETEAETKNTYAILFKRKAMPALPEREAAPAPTPAPVLQERRQLDLTSQVSDPVINPMQRSMDDNVPNPTKTLDDVTV